MIMYWKTKLKLLLLLSSFLCYPAISKGCTTTAPLGLSNGLIRNYQITASSYLSTDNGDFSPSQARLGIRNCWCGSYAGKGNWKDEWLQITFEKPTIVKAVATQGNPHKVASFVKKFSLEFSDNGNVFYPLNDTSGNIKEFVGNVDNNKVKLNSVSVAFSTRFVRFRAKEINNSYDGSVCLRMELYGCQAAKDANYGPSMFPLGIETGAIQDSALSASSELSGKEARFARLNNGAGWCASSASGQWLQVNLGRVFMVNAIATQGFGAKNSNEMVASYQISYSLNSTNFVLVEDLPGRVKTFPGNTESNQEPVIGVLSEPVRAKIIRIIPKTKGLKSSMYCMRVELFGHVEKCYKSIAARPGLTFSSSTTKTGTTHQNAFLFSNDVWCANVNDASQFIKMEFGTALQVSGIAIQGDVQHSSSVSSFKIKYKPPCGTETELATTFNAIYDRHRVSRHWFTSSIKTEYITITPVTWSNNICLRFHILGCPDSLKRVPLGMRSGFISSSQITASSTYNDDVKYKPGQARLDIQSRWCGAKIGLDLVNDYHQVDFGRMIVLNGIATQGDPIDTTNYVKKFYLEIGNTTTTFVPIKRCSNNHIFTGNVDATNIKYNYFDTSVVTRYVRFRATEVGRTDANRRVCLRLEYYGTAIDGPPASASKVLYPLGMENGIISDSQLSANDGYNYNPAKNGRLRKISSGWCSGTAKDGWMRIIFPQFMSITAVALQGHGYPGSPDRTYKYHIQYKLNNAWENLKNSSGVDQLFIGNKDTQSDPVIALLPSPLSVKDLRINPYELGTGSLVYCLRAEFYGYRSDCSDDLTLSSNSLISGSSFSSMDFAPVSHIYNPISWCADSSDVNPFLIVNLGSPKKITGFGVQGDSNGDNWPTKVKVSHGNQLCCLTEMNKEFIGNSDRNLVARHWFENETVAQFLKIRINTRNGNACMRVQVLGCDSGYGRTPLGMGNGFIPDSQVTATSRFNSWENKWKASTARLRVTGCRWCSIKPLDYKDYLQVDFQRDVTLTGIATQGDDGYISNYVKKFYLEVTSDGSNYRVVEDTCGLRQNFIANTDNNGIAYNWLSVPTKARSMRFRASDVSGGHICARIELYGSSDDRAAGKSLFPLGLESGVIKDSQISDSGDFNSNPSRFGRFRGGKGWCANGGNDEWMQIDLKQPMVITAVATQGHGDPNSPDRTYEYYLKYSYNQLNTYEFVKDSTNTKKLFKGNKEFQNVPALNVLPVPVTARFIRINPRTLGTGSSYRCLRAELFGYHPDCSDDLTNLSDCQITASSSKRVNTAYTAKVNSDVSWCPTSTTTTEYIEVNLGHLHRVTGVGIQGDSENDFWPKKFKISHGKYKGCLSEMSEEFIANKDRNGVTRHWFSGKIIAQFIRFRVTSFNGAGPVCLRIQVLGCKKIMEEPKVNDGRTPLGMGNGFIADSQITATSKYSEQGKDKWKGSTARLRVTGCRWCSKQPLNYRDYLQVDFQRDVTLTGMATQGDDNNNLNYVKTFYLEVSSDGSNYRVVEDTCGLRQNFTANTNNNGIVYNWLSVPTKARSMRFRASDVSGTHICARIELYGSSNDRAAGKSLFTLGLESGVIKDSQISESGNFNSNPARFGRFRGGKGWCANTGNNEWMQIDLKQPMVITAVATQGHGGGGSPDRTYEYYLKYSYNQSNTYEFVKDSTNTKKVFKGNKEFQNVPALNLLPVPVTAQFFRINPKSFGTGSSYRCLRAEIFGYHPVCSDDLTTKSMMSASSSLDGNSPRNVHVYSPNTWCAKSDDSNGYIDVILNQARVVSGVGIQGDSNAENWIKTFKISHAVKSGSFKEISNVFKGSNDRNSVVRNWLLPPVFAKYLRIKADTFQTKLCARVQILGCSTAPTTVLSSVSARKNGAKTIKVDWDKTSSYENLNWVLKGVSILIKCSGDLRTKSCSSFTTKEVNVTDITLGSSLVSGLESWTNYTVQVQVYNGGDRGPLSSEVTVVTAEEAPSKAPTISSITAKKTSLELKVEDYPKDKRNGELVGYHVLFRCIQTDKTRDCSDLSVKNKTIIDASKTMIIILKLSTWTRYEVRVQVYNRAGSSPISAAFNKTTLETAPSAAPSGVKAKVINATCIEITWKLLIKNDTNGVLKKYVVTMISSRDSSTKTIDVLNNWGRFNVTGLKPFTNYRVEVAAVNSIGSGPKSDKVTVKTMEAAPSKAPSIELFAAEKFAANFTVKNINEEDENGIIIGYKISFKCVETQTTRNCSNSDVTVKDISASKVTEFRLTKLKSWTRYSVRVQVSTKAGISPFSSELLFSTLEEVPRLPPRHITLKTVSSRSLLLEWKHLKWDDTNGIISGYSIGIIKLGSTEKLLDAPGSSKSSELLGLDPYTNYTVRIAAVNKAGRGPYSSGLTQLTFEEAPSEAPIITSVKSFTKSAELRIQNINKTSENGKILGYTVFFSCVRQKDTRDCSNTTWTTLNTSLSGPLDRYVIRNLSSWTAYRLKLAVYNSKGNGPFSTEEVFVTEEEAPSKSLNLLLMSASSRNVFLKIKNIDRDEANGILHGYSIFIICRSTNISRTCLHTTVQSFKISKFPVTSYSLQNLTSWTRYDIHAVVFNNAGESPKSNILDFITDEEAPSRPPSDVSVERKTSRSFVIIWSHPERNSINGILRSFVINLTDTKHAKSKFITVDGEYNSYNVSKLLPYRNYTVAVAVVNSIARGPFSQAIAVQTDEEAPSRAPVILRVSAEQNNATLWIQNINETDANGVLIGYRVILVCVSNENTRYCRKGFSRNITFLGVPRSSVTLVQLPSWTRFSIALLVYNKAGESSLSEPLEVTTKEEAISRAPINVTYTSVTSRSFELHWSFPDRDFWNGIITSSVIHVEARRELPRNFTVLKMATNLVVEKLLPFTNYSVWIYLTNSVGRGPATPPIAIQTAEEAPSEAPLITNFTAARKTFTLQIKGISAENLHGTPLGYKITYRCISSNITRDCKNRTWIDSVFDYSTSTSVTISGVSSWMKYEVKVCVFNKVGAGLYSNVIRLKTAEEVPEPISKITVVATSPRSLRVSWMKLPKDQTNGMITQYSIRYNRVTDVPTYFNMTTLPTVTTAEISSLKPYTAYLVTIAAVNKAGVGSYAAGTEFLMPEAAPESSPTITEASADKHYLSFTIKNIEKSSENGKMLGYFVAYRCITSDETRDCNDPVKKNLTVTGYPKATIKISQLYSWMKYGITLQAYNKAGASKRSNEITNTTKEDKPSAPPNNIAVAVSGSRGLKITWNPLAKNDTNGIITRYHVVLEFTRRGVKENRERFTADTNLNLDTLYPYTIYTVTVAAENSAGIGKYSNGLQNRTEQDAPSAPSITDALPKGTTEVLIKWNPPQDMNGIITKYELCYYLASASNCTIRVLPSNQTEALARNLETHVNYTFKIRAFTIKAGNWSDIVIQKTEIGVPTAPLNPQISDIQSTSLRLSWTKPEKPRGILISYKIKLTGRKLYNSSFLHSSIVEGSCNDPCTSRLLSGLVPGTSYTFSVAVATSADLGPYSVEVSGITLVAGPPKPMFNVISSFKEGGTERNITINSVSNVNGPIISYQVIVERITGSGSSPMINFPELLLKTEAEEKSLNYYLAKSTLPNLTPFLLRFKPGISYVEAFGSDLETPGNYYLHFRAVTQAYLKPRSKKVYGEASVYKLERKFMNKLPEPASKDISAYTIQLQLTIALPKAFTPSYYYVIAIELVSGTSPQDPSTYQPQDLKKYDPVTTKPGTPYIAAVISSSDFSKSKQFILGDGKTTSTSSSRRKRQARAVKDEYVNSALKADKVYSVFIRAVSASSTYYSTPWTSELRTKVAPKTTTESSGQGGAIAAGVTVSLLVVIAGVALGFYFRRRRLMYGKPTESTEYLDEIEVKDLKRPKLPPTPEAAFATTEVDGVPYEPVNLKITKNPAYPSFPAKNIVQVFRRKCALEDAGFKEEFESLPQGQLFTWNIGCQIDNKPRNRFANIIAYDYSRVKLVNSQDESDYINASYVVDYNGRPRYIASQAPVVKTVPNFWTMIWEQEIPAIVMLTKCVEGNKRKSEEYWPTSGSEQYGNIKVSFLGAEEFPEYTIATMELEFGKSRRTFKHFHYLTWPDHGVPTYPTALLSFRRRLRQAFPFDSQTEKPIVVHCSAGVGRTGAFIAIDTLIHLIHKQRIVDVFSFVRVLRLQRPQMVQRWAQFKFIYDCLLEAAVCGVTEISTQEFRQRYNHLSNADQKTGNDGFHKEFACLSFVATEIEEEEFSSAKQSCITHKNRDPTVLPRNTQRVFLPAIEFTEGCNYINAVYVDGNDKDQFIATQAPLESTIGDFWRMVVDRDSSTVISLVNDDEVFPRYWPKSNEASYDNGNIKVNLQETQKITENLTKRTFITTDNMFNRTSNDIHVFNLNEWPDHSVPESVMSLVQLIDEAERTQRSLGGGPIIVHCSTGGGRTGTFIAAYTILERLKDEQMIDVFQVVRRIRKTRPKFVENKEQYKLLYDVVACYLEQFSTYSNF